MTKTKKVKKKSCAKVPKKVKATFKEECISYLTPSLGTPASGVLTNCVDQPLHDIISNGNLSELWPHVVKKIETLQRSKMISFVCFVVIAFALIAAIPLLYPTKIFVICYLLLPCLVISVFKTAEIFFSELPNN